MTTTAEDLLPNLAVITIEIQCLAHHSCRHFPLQDHHLHLTALATVEIKTIVMQQQRHLCRLQALDHPLLVAVALLLHLHPSLQ